MAVEPPPPLVAAIREIPRPARPGLRWTSEEQWHVTLRFFAAVDSDALVEALGRLARPGAHPVVPDPVVAVAGPAPVVLSRSVLVVPVDGLAGLASAVARATAALAEPEGRSFRGHLTLARARQPEELRGITLPAVAVRWTVQEIAAFRSELRPDGAHHERLGRWPVSGG